MSQDDRQDGDAARISVSTAQRQELGFTHLYMGYCRSENIETLLASVGTC